MTKTKQVLIALALVVVGFVLGAAVYSRVSPSSGNLGAVIGEDLRVAGNLYNGYNDTLIAQSGVVVGNVSSASVTASVLTSGTSTLGNTVIGNGVLSLSLVSSTASTNLTAAQFCGNGVVTVTNDGAQATSTLTFPVATSTFATCMTNLGSRKFIDIINTSSTSLVVTIASSTGTTMVKPFNGSSTFTVIGGGTAHLELRQLTSSTSNLIVERLQ